MYCAELYAPTFTKGKEQLSGREVDVSRRMARVKIHVKQVIGMVKQKYSILSSKLLVNFWMHADGNQDYGLLDKIVTVCSALCNFCGSVIPFHVPQ